MDKLCSNWLSLVPKANLKAAKPDMLDGFGLSDLAEHKLLRDHLDKLIVPGTALAFLPNFFTEIKGPDSITDVATKQALYDGAYGARGMYHTRRLYAGDDLDGKAYAFSATYTGGTLTLYAHTLSRPPGNNSRMRYHMSQLDGQLLTRSPKALREGVTAYRNLRDLAAQIRTEVARAATQRLRALVQSKQSLPDVPLTPYHGIPDHEFLG